MESRTDFSGVKLEAVKTEGNKDIDRKSQCILYKSTRIDLILTSALP